LGVPNTERQKEMKIFSEYLNETDQQKTEAQLLAGTRKSPKHNFKLDIKALKKKPNHIFFQSARVTRRVSVSKQNNSFYKSITDKSCASSV
jgi:hypothetical protein